MGTRLSLSSLWSASQSAAGGRSLPLLPRHRLYELLQRRVPIGRRLLQGPVDDRFQVLRHPGTERPEARHRVQCVLPDHRHSVGSRERRLARQQLVHDAGESVLVAAGVHLGIAQALLRAHVVGSSY